MTITNELHRPEPLVDFLDRGGDLRAALGVHFAGFWCDDLRELAFCDEAERERQIAIDRAHIEASLCGESLRCADGPSIPPIIDQEHLTRDAWRCDLMTDPEGLMPRIRALLTFDERANLDYTIDCQEKPYPLEVVKAYRPEIRFNCDGCGHIFVEGEPAMAIGARENWSEPPEGELACATSASPMPPPR